MDNMTLYNKFRFVPAEAKKPITAGRLKGMTNIEPMWRIKSLTEQFGPCGVGWYTNTTSITIFDGNEGEKVVSLEIELYVKNGSEWSKPIYGVGGAKLVVKESKGLYTDDEAIKKAYTDAVSVACKSLGMGADVYFGNDRHSKYPTSQPEKEDANTLPPPNESNIAEILCERCRKPVSETTGKDGNIITAAQVVDCSRKMFSGAVYCCECQKALKQKQREAQNNGASA